MNVSAQRVHPAVARWMLTLLVLASVLSVGDRMLLGVVTEAVRADLGLSDLQMALANGVFFALFHFGGGFLVARLVDWGNRKQILAIGIFVWSIATAATGLADDFTSLSIARFGVGIAEASVFPAAMSLIPDLFEKKVHGRALATFQTSGFIGVMVCSSVAGVVAASFGWRIMFQLFGAVGVVFALLVQLTGREPRRAGPVSPEAASLNCVADLAGACGRVIAMPGFFCLAIAFGLAAMVAAVIGSWGPAFLQRSHGVSLAQVGFAIGLASGIGGIAGTLIAGMLIDGMAKRAPDRSAAMLRIPIVILPLSVPFLLGFVFAPSIGATVACSGGMSFMLGCAVAPCMTYAVTCVAPADRGLASIVMLAAAGLVGSALGPIIIATISDLLAARLGSESLRYALSVLVLAPLSAVLLLVLSRRQIAVQSMQAATHGTGEPAG